MHHLYKILKSSLFFCLLVLLSTATFSQTNSRSDVPANELKTTRLKLINPVFNTVSPLACSLTGALGAGDLTMTSRLSRPGAATGSCALAYTIPATIAGGPFFYDTYSVSNSTGTAQCVTFSLTTTDLVNANIQFGVYNNSFDPTNLATNYLADPGASTGTPAAAPLNATVTVPACANLIVVIFSTNANTAASGTALNYSLSLDNIPCTPPPACSGVPNPGNTVSSATAACLGVPFTLSAQNATCGTGVTYQWQSSATGVAGSYANITGATSPTLTLTQTTATFYRLNVTCGASTTPSNPLQVNMAAPSNCYCSAGATSTSFEKISRVQFNTINNPSTAIAGYEDFTAISTTITQGVPIPITVTLSGGFASDQVIVFIDYNQNGSFTDPGETVFTSALGAGPHSGTITIPFTATAGSTRMRVRMHDASSTPANATSCGVSAFGQVEDYTINIPVVVVCSGIPNPGNTIATPASVCAGVNFTLSLQNNTTGAGVTYQWQSSLTGAAGSFTNITGATNATLTTSQTVATFYRANVTCGANTTGSNPVQVTMTPFLNCYCAAGSPDVIFEKISRVQFNTINNPSTSTAGYEDFTAISTTIGSGTTAPITVTIAGGFAADQVIVFIDYNHNGSFADAGETVYTSPTGVGPHTGNITIPGSALTGITRMRIRMHDSSLGANATSCGNSSYGQVEDYTLNIQCTAATISLQPVNTPICVGGSAALTINATGTNLSYQWQVSTDNGATYNNISDGATYSGTTTSTLIINGVNATFNGFRYRVIINGPCTPVNTTSAAAIISISTPPAITQQPVNASACATSNTSFTVLTSGPSVFVQWQVSTDGGVNFTNIPGANSPTLVLTGVTFAMNGYKYRAIVNGQAPCIALVTNVVTLTVFPLPTITIEPDPVTKLLPGLKTTLTATVTPPLPTSIITWFRDGFPVPGALGNTYVVDVDGLGTYTAKVTDANGCTVTSNSVLIGDSSSGKIFIYPSPNNGQFQVRYYSALGNTLARSLVIYNALGEKVMSRVVDVTGAYGKVSVDLRNTGKGIFWVELWVGNTRLAHGKVLVQ